MSGATRRRRRWFQFGTSSLLIAVALIAILVHHLNWIRERHGHVYEDWFTHPDGPVYVAGPASAPGMLWLFGEGGRDGVEVVVDDPFAVEVTPSDVRKATRAQRLFPEAKLYSSLRVIAPDGVIYGRIVPYPATTELRRQTMERLKIEYMESRVAPVPYDHLLAPLAPPQGH